jgi:hypothetical protein
MRKLTAKVVAAINQQISVATGKKLSAKPLLL